MKVITLEIHEDIEEKLEEYLIQELREVFKIPQDMNAEQERMSDYELWLSTPEGRLHSMLINNYVLKSPRIDAKTAMTIQRRVQFQGKETRGRPRIYRQGLHDWTTQRQVRLFFLNKLLAKSLGINAEGWDLPPKIAQMQKEITVVAPTDAYDSLVRFESWSGVTLPEDAWELVTKRDRIELAKEQPDLPVGPDGDVTFKAYARHRAKNLEFSPEISDVLCFDSVSL